MPTRPPTHRPSPKAKVHLQDRQRTRALNTGSKAWRMLRTEILVRDNYTCADCKRFGDEVDHIDGNSHNNDRSNLATRCASCHSKKTAREQGNVVS